MRGKKNTKLKRKRTPFSLQSRIRLSETRSAQGVVGVYRPLDRRMLCFDLLSNPLEWTAILREGISTLCNVSHRRIVFPR